jgi:hypothetical protein
MKNMKNNRRKSIISYTYVGPEEVFVFRLELKQDVSGKRKLNFIL